VLRQRAEDGDAAEAHAERTPHADVDGERLDRERARAAVDAHAVEAAPKREERGVAGVLGELLHEGGADLAQPEAGQRGKAELVGERAERIALGARNARDEPLVHEGAEDAVQRRPRHAAAREKLVEPQAFGAARGERAQHADGLANAPGALPAARAGRGCAGAPLRQRALSEPGESPPRPRSRCAPRGARAPRRRWWRSPAASPRRRRCGYAPRCRARIRGCRRGTW